MSARIRFHACWQAEPVISSGEATLRQDGRMRSPDHWQGQAKQRVEAHVSSWSVLPD